MNRTLIQLTPPASEPVTLAEARQWCRVEADDDDSLISGLISAARSYVEMFTRRAILTQRWKLLVSSFPTDPSSLAPIAHWYATAWDGPLVLPRAPLAAVESIRFYSGGTLSTWDPASYVAVPGSPGRIRPVQSAWWPILDYRDDALQVTFRAGYGDAIADVPADVAEPARLAMRLLVSSWYANREAALTGLSALPIPYGVEAVLSPLLYGVYC
ncbi:MAG: head-tail connector protein [Isosphaeraceae bacterium]